MIQSVAYNNDVRGKRMFRCTYFKRIHDSGRFSCENNAEMSSYWKLCVKHFTPNQFKIHPGLAKKC